MIVELRSTGHQTIVPPSVHPSGEQIEWKSRGEPTTVEEAILRTAIDRVAGAALLLRRYPEQGARDRYCLALAGELLPAGRGEDETEQLICHIAAAAGDEAVKDRATCVASTLKRLRAGQTIWAFPFLVDEGMLDPREVACLRKWLALDEPRPSEAEVRREANALTGSSTFTEIRGVLTQLRAAGLGPLEQHALLRLIQERTGQKVGIIKEEYRRAERARATNIVQTAVPYTEHDGGIWFHERQLTNFTARIVEERALEDGSGLTQRILMLESPQFGSTRIAADDFPDVEHWLLSCWGARAVLHPNPYAERHVRAAIQLLSGSFPVRMGFRQFGWHTVDGTPMYVHAGGAIGSSGPVPDVLVDPDGPLAQFVLPVAEDVQAAIRASLELLELPPHLAYPLFAAIFAAPLDAFFPLTVSLFIVGPSGVYKSALCGVCAAWGPKRMALGCRAGPLRLGMQAGIHAEESKVHHVTPPLAWGCSTCPHDR